MNDYKVYVHIAPNNKKYVGVTKSKKPENRWGSKGAGYKNQILFWRAIQKYGWDNFQHVILLDNLTKSDAIKYEKFYIAQYQSNNSKFGYNLTEGGEGISGYKFSEEHCKNQSARMLGHTVSKETREKIGRANSRALKGKKLSEETKQKLSKALSGKNHPMYGKKQPRDAVERMRQKQMGNKYHLGHKVSDESRKRMSDAHKGKPLSEAQKAQLKRLHERNKGRKNTAEQIENIKRGRQKKKNERQEKSSNSKII